MKSGTFRPAALKAPLALLAVGAAAETPTGIHDTAGDAAEGVGASADRAVLLGGGQHRQGEGRLLPAEAPRGRRREGRSPLLRRPETTR